MNKEKFIEELNKLNKPVWIRQVIIPGINDNIDYIIKLKEFLKIPSDKCYCLLVSNLVSILNKIKFRKNN